MYGTRWLKKFCKGDESLEDEGCSGQPLEVDNNQLRGSLKLILIQLHKKLPKNSGSTILWSAGIWSKLERWKSLISGCLMSWPQIKNIFLMRCLVLFCTTTNHFCDTIDLWHTTKSGFYMTTGNNNQLSGWTQKKLQKALPKAKRAPKKRSRSLVGGLLPFWYTTAFWIPAHYV